MLLSDSRISYFKKDANSFSFNNNNNNNNDNLFSIYKFLHKKYTQQQLFIIYIISIIIIIIQLDVIEVRRVCRARSGKGINYTKQTHFSTYISTF